MDDGLRITNDKRHRSSSSLAGVIEGVRSERKLDLRASIPEVDEKFAVAEARCNDLQHKINLVKTLKRKKKLKKRSITTIVEPGTTVDNTPLIAVRTEPKKKVSQQAARLRRLEVPSNTRGYVDPDLIEQHQMLGRVHAYKHEHSKLNKKRASQQEVQTSSPTRSNLRRARAAGDTVYGQNVQNRQNVAQDVTCGDDELSDNDVYDIPNANYTENSPINIQRYYDSRPQSKQKPNKQGIREPVSHTAPTRQWVESAHERWSGSPSPSNRHNNDINKRKTNIGTNIKQSEDSPVVELFSKSRQSVEPRQRKLNINIAGQMKDLKAGDSLVYEGEGEGTGPLEYVTPLKPKKQKGRRVKYHSRRYEMPTVSSQMKQAGLRYYYGNTNHTNIPFIVSKSTAPSHNIGVNLQQVLNGLKVKQPLSGIPLTIAHHMGLRHIPTFGTNSATMQPMLNNNEINVIKLGRKMLHLPSYKYMSYNRLLSLYREGDGIVPRFLRAISRPHYFYTSMYNLATNREDFDGATSKGHADSQAAKRSLAEYANLYREYQHVDKCLHDNYDPELEVRKDNLARQLAVREEHIRKVVQEYQPADVDPLTLRASASTADEGYRHSTFSLKRDDPK